MSGDRNTLKKGYTTGTCAQAAAKGSCFMLTTGRLADKVDVVTPSGVKLNLSLRDQRLGEGFAECSVIKDSGDDPDVTDRVKIFARAAFSERRGVDIKGANGVGIVTRPGLAIKVGGWAINPVPRKMILREASRFLPKDSGLEITISVPGGKAIAKQTYNPRLGIEGGISIIGTTGIVEPKSLEAYRKSLALELNVLKARGYKNVVLVLGYVGDKYAQSVLKTSQGRIIKIGDHIGFMLRECAKKGMKEIILIGHIGKLIKITAGQFNTHCKFGDNRVSEIARYARRHDADKQIISDILRQTTAEATVKILKEAGLARVFKRIREDVSRKCEKLVSNKVRVKTILLSLDGKALAKS